MCGFAFIQGSNDLQTLSARTHKIFEMLRRRGPDSGEILIDTSELIAFVHRRLAIVDRSDAGSQPMTSSDGRYVMIYNGEIYNHEELRSQDAALNNVGWRGHSDSETLLEMIAHLGLEGTLERLNGMYALCVWDRCKGIVSICRDPSGQKPLYYSLIGKQLVCSSDFTSLANQLSAPTKGDLNQIALEHFIRHSYIPAPQTIDKRIKKLKPGETLHWNLKTSTTSSLQRDLYFQGKETIKHQFEDLVPLIHKALRLAIKRHLLAEVPVGVFLSGGIDSALVAAIATEEYNARLKTFTARFSNESCDESAQASLIARRIGSEHHEVDISDEKVLDAFDQIQNIWGEPFADPAQIPAIVLAKYAKNEVSVVLTGDGGDEYFGGYRKYRIANQLMQLKGVKGGSLLTEALKGILSLLGSIPLPHSLLNLSATAIRLRDLLDCDTISDLAAAMDSRYTGVLPLIGESGNTDTEQYPQLNLTAINQYDIMRYLPEDLMVKSDRSGMAYGLELRSPFLDTDLISIASELTIGEHIGRKGKRITREIAKQYFPDVISGKSKTGFGVPMAKWMRGPLEQKFELIRSSLDDDEFPLDKKWASNILASWQRGDVHQLRLVWNLLVFAQWFMGRKIR
jgi:asparagine synthase (glutamine-hydrolysing)